MLQHLISRKDPSAARNAAYDSAFSAPTLTPPNKALRVAKILIAPLALGICLLLLWHRLEGVSLQMIGGLLASYSWWQWALAGAATLVSFGAIAATEFRLHLILRTQIPPKQARRAGMAGVAVSQALGLGTLTGAMARWRALPQAGFWTATQLSIAMSVGFLAAMGGLLGLVQLGLSAGWLAAILLPLAVMAALRPSGPLISARLPVDARDLAALLFWTAVDTGLAAFVLWLFLPSGSALGAAPFFIAYLLALGAGLLSQSPGGIGAFEMVLMAALPHIPASELMAAALAYRLTYHIAPALVALLWLVRPQKGWAEPDLHPVLARNAPRIMTNPPEAAWGMAWQNGALMMSACETRGWQVRCAPHILVALGLPLGAPDLAGLCAVARRAGRQPLVYGTDAKTAASARKAGWAVVCVNE
ncbi:MAG: UPF0104 family protein, partial [Rhodobacteraceae bacterium]|nr:UPF0104 family protein [Paracoccaceae bacterium]